MQGARGASQAAGCSWMQMCSYLIGQREGDDQRCHQYVCRGQRHQEEVLWGPQGSTGEHRHHHQHVSHHRAQNDDCHHQHDEDRGHLRVRSQRRRSRRGGGVGGLVDAAVQRGVCWRSCRHRGHRRREYIRQVHPR